MNWDMNVFNLSNIADILSILGAFLSLFNLLFIKRIKESLLLRINIKRYKKELKDRVQLLANYLNEYRDNKNNIKELINIIDIKAQHIKSRNKNISKHIKELHRMIKEYNRNMKKGHDESIIEDQVREIKTQLTIIVEELNEQEQSYKLGGN